MDSSELLRSAHLKFHRGLEHLKELIRLTNPLSPDLYVTDYEMIDVSVIAPLLGNQYGKSFGISYIPIQPIPEMLALRIGDSVHNFRAALDHLCTAIVRAKQNSTDVRTKRVRDDTNFPFRSIWDELEGTFGKLEAALPGSKEMVLRHLRPKNGPNEHIWQFNKLDNIDKHNLLIPTITIANISAREVQLPNGLDVNLLGFGGNAAERVGLYGQATPFDWGPLNFQVAVELTFGDVDGFSGSPVVPTLMKIGDLVAGTIAAFEQLLNAKNA